MDADDWNRRYATAELVWSAGPNRFLADEAADLTPGSAVDLACGEGRNAVWLAERGWKVTGVDFASAGLDKGRRAAAGRGVEVTWVEADVLDWEPPAPVDLFAVCYLQLPAPSRRRAVVSAARGLAAGGTLVVVAHDRRNLQEGTGGPQDASVLYGADDVVEDLRSSGVAMVIERADTVEREVPGADRPALDCLVRASRPVSP